MALDNPSYFSIASGSEPSSSTRPFDLDTMGAAASTSDNISSSSSCSLTRQLTPPRGSYQNKGRTLVRSSSSNSADSNQELLIMGEPRFSDIAPDLASSTNHHRNASEPRRTNSLKNTTKSQQLQCHDLMYFPLPTTDDAGPSEASADEEVFLSENSARYYNFAAISANDDRRRHSISAFVTRERTASVASSSRSFKEDRPQAIVHATVDGQSVGTSSSINIDEHSLRHGSYPRKRCNRCTKKPLIKRTDMEDILIISIKQSSAATLWVDYFNSYFQHICKQANRKPFKVYHLGAEEVLETSTNIKLIQERISCVKLQLIIVCPSLLEHISWNPTSSTRLGKLIIPDRTLALLLGVADDDLSEAHRTALSTYSQWQRLSVGLDQDENFTKEFLGTAVSILSRVWKQQTSVSPQQKSLFSVLPKKVRQGHGSVVIILTHPLQREDIVKVSIERNNEIIEVKSVKQRNPYTLKITIPDSCTEVSAIVHILVEKNGSIIGSSPIKCESRLRELEQILRSSENPVEFMCQALGFSPVNKEHMDNCLVYSFQKNMPPNFTLLFNQLSAFGANNMYAHRHGHEEYPTLLHFAARYGLEKLTMQLLDCPGGDVACDIRNSCDLTPSEIAQNAGHTELAHILSGYMKMNEFKNVYEKLKEMSMQNKDSDEEVDGYLTPTQCGDNIYKICPPPKPFHPPFPSPTTAHSPTPGYMTMKLSGGKTGHTEAEEPPIDPKPSELTLNLNAASPLTPPQIRDQEVSPTLSQRPFEICEDKVQTELLEIINDFKNNVHSISQVEKLVEEWKNRNDVQKSFKEKQEQLNEMRQKYEKIQHDMKHNMKKATPFERVKKIFFKGKSSNKESANNRNELPGLASTIINTPVYAPTPRSLSLTSTQSQRPISSLSLHSTSSSGSSGRMSTISGCSIGDSGTHSDQEERKTILGNPTDDEFRNELNKAIINLNYAVLPPPRPFNPGKLTTKNTFPTIEERPPQPTPRPLQEDTADMYYIEFPPSGRPVHGYHETKIEVEEQPVYLDVDNLNRNYINLQGSGNKNPINTMEHGNSDSDDFHEYMNYVPPTTNAINKSNQSH